MPKEVVSYTVNDLKNFIDAAKEMREACAASFRAAYLTGDDATSNLIAECNRVGVRDGFGVRLQEQIGIAEKAAKYVEDLCKAVK